MHGALTEGRFIVFEQGGWALTSGGKDFQASKATATHNDANQRFVVHALVEGGNIFTISDSKDGKYCGSEDGTANGAETYRVTYVAGNRYALMKATGTFVAIDTKGDVHTSAEASYFKAYSVTYSS